MLKETKLASHMNNSLKFGNLITLDTNLFLLPVLRVLMIASDCINITYSLPIKQIETGIIFLFSLPILVLYKKLFLLVRLNIYVIIVESYSSEMEKIS